MFHADQVLSDLYVLLTFDGFHLFVPQDDIESVEIIADVLVIHTAIGAIGWFGQHGYGGDSPVFCFSNVLTLLPDLPESREYFVLLKAPEQPLGIACDEVETINMRSSHLHPQPLPLTMRTENSPISQLLIYEEGIACLCQGGDLIRHTQALSEQFLAARE
jgi:hypothetical protein